VEFARTGSIFSRRILGIESPRVGLLSNGAEESKGNNLVLETYPLLKKDKTLNFIGNIEGHDIAGRARTLSSPMALPAISSSRPSKA